ncbi:hypothetical protein ACWEFL_24880 [Streptomyces sp. NPDC004838]
MPIAPHFSRTAVTLCALAALVLTGCSGGDSGGPDAGKGKGKGKGSPSATARPEVKAYYSCLEKNDVVLETSEGGEPRVDKDKNNTAAITKAEEKCRDLLPTPASAPVSAKALAAARELSACVREKGFKDYPDPDPATGDVPDSAAAAAKSDPGLVAALEECTPDTGAGDGINEGG